MTLQLRTAVVALAIAWATASCAQTPAAAAPAAPPSTAATASTGSTASPAPATPPTTTAAATPSATTLAAFGDQRVSLADYEAWVNGTIPERDRFGWAMNQNNINKVINDLLRVRTVAAEARKRGFDKDPVLKLRVEQYTEKLLQEMLAQRVEEEANREFEQKRASFTERAREQYLINKSKYQRPREVKASHILVDARSRSADEALAKIKVLRARAVAGEPFDKLAEANSDDPSARNTKGDLGYFGPGRMEPTFEAAAFALQKPNDISEPVKTQFGWHIIRLEDIHPAKQLTFEEALPDLLETLRTQYLSTRSKQVLDQYYDPSKVKWNEPAVVGLKKTVDPTIFKAPEQLK